MRRHSNDVSLCQTVPTHELEPMRARGEGLAFDSNRPTNVTTQLPLEGNETLPMVPLSTGSGYEYVHDDDV